MRTLLLMMSAASLSSAATFFYTTKKMSPELLASLTQIAKTHLRQIRTPASQCDPQVEGQDSLDQTLTEKDLSKMLQKMQEAKKQRDEALRELGQ